MVDQKHSVQVSVVLAIKNESKYIASALESITAQRNVDFEAVVVDDNSTDDTRDLVASLSAKDPRIRQFSNPGKGKVSAFNYGVEQSRGAFVCLFAGDDLMPQDSLSARFQVVQSHQADAPVVGLSKLLTISENKRYDGQLIPRAKGKGNPSGQSPLMNRSAAAIIFPVPETLPNEDTWIELAVEFLGNLRIVSSDVICCYYRIHENNSYNHELPHSAFKARIVDRQRAHPLFLDHFDTLLSQAGKLQLTERIRCHAHYESGELFPILFASAPLIFKLRLLSSAAVWTYELRRRLFKFFSGWT